MKITSLRSVLTPLLSAALLVFCVGSFSNAQQSAAVVPTLVNFRGTLTDLNGKPLTGTVGVTFLLYKDQQGGAPLWIETQNVQADKYGRYSVTLGSTRSVGLPTDVFVSGEARWMGVQPQGQAEQPRVLLLSVPYALKAGDAQTVGGLPASAFVLAAPAAGNVAATESGALAATATAASAPPPSSNVTTTGGTVSTLPMFTTANNIQNSLLTQTGTTTINVVGKLNLPAQGAATATKGFSSRPEAMVASAFNSGTSKAVAQTFQLQAEPSNNNTATPSATLNLLYGSGTAAPTETGLKINNKGLLTFATGQTFPGMGTITGVTAGTDLTGGGTSGKVTLNLDTTKVPQLNTANAFSQAMSVNVNNPLAGAINATSAYQAIVGTMTSNDSFAAAITGNASATGTGTTIGVFGQSSTASGYGVWGVGAGSSGSGVYGSSSSGYGVNGSTATGYGVYGTSTAGGIGVFGQSSFAGVYGISTATGYGVLGVANGSAGQGVWGESNGTGFSNGAGSDGVHGVSHSSAGSGVAGINDAKDSTGVYGSDPQGYGFVTDSHVSQARSAGGWVKAMAYVNIVTGAISRCFNSQLAGSAASTPPCGMTTVAFASQLIVDFGFEVDDRFVQVTFTNPDNQQYYGLSSDGYSISNTQVLVVDTATFVGPAYIVVN